MSAEIIMEKIMSAQCSTFRFDRIFLNLAGNENRHKISDEFDFGPDQKISLELLALERRNISPLSYNGKHVVSKIALSLLIKPSSNSQVTRSALNLGRFRIPARLDYSSRSFLPLSAEKNIFYFVWSMACLVLIESL